MALAIFRGSSSISTTSAASMAASEPMAPMAMPISARDSTGASLMPSPTKASLRLVGFAAAGASTCSTLSGRQQLAVHLVHAQFCGHAGRPPRWTSPVSMTVFSTPACFQGGDGLFGVGLDHVGNDDVAGILTVDGHMDDGADADGSRATRCPAGPSACCCPRLRRCRPPWP